MANENNFQAAGPIAAQTVVETLVGNTGATRWIKKTIVLDTNGTTEVPIFGTTNGIAGTFIGASIVSKDDANGNITLQNNPAGTVSTIFTIAKGSQGASKGSAFAAVAFSATGTATVKSSAASNARVEIDFIVSHPGLIGAQ